MAASRAREKSVLSRQDIASRRKAIQQQKMKTSPTGKRAIFGVFLLTISVLALLSVASFDARDRLGPGFHNAIGPVGHALAESLRGFLGICAWVLPLAGLYTVGLLFANQPKQRRWPQILCLGLLLVSGSVLAHLMFKDDGHWAHAPGGLLGREVGGALAALFGTVGTVVLVSALASVALIVGTQFAFLRLCTLIHSGAVLLGKKLRVLALAFFEAQKKRLELRKIAQAKAAEEEAAFLAELEAQEAELAELEASAEEAEAIADENARMARENELSRLKQTEAAKLHKLAEKEQALNEKLVEREAAQLERDALKAEREALRAAREGAKERERLEKEQQRAPLPVPAPAAAAQSSPRMLSVGDEPAWASSLGPVSLPPTPVTHSMIQSAPSQPPRRGPAIVMPPPPPTQAFDSLPPVAAEALAAVAATPVAQSAEQSSALMRTPIIVEPKAPPKPTKKKEQEQFEFVGDRKSFVAPPMDVLEANQTQRVAVDKEAYLATAAKLSSKLRDFGIEGDVVEIRPGPVVTMYEFKPAPGIKISRIASLSDDLAMAMEAMRVRIVAPIPGKGVVGIEVPNKDRETVFLKEIAEQDAFQKSTSRLTMCLGKDIEGMPYVFDLAKAPHLLIAGTTGSGKSVAVNAMIMSILLKSTPEEVRFIMVDPKMLELSVYEGIPHLLLPVVTDPRKASIALQWAVDEMTRRYKLLAEAGVRNIAGYNAMLDAEAKKTAPVIEGKVVIAVPPANPLAPPVAAAAVAAVAAAPLADAPKKKARKLLIVDVADELNPAAVDAAPAAEAPVSSELQMGVAAPREALEDPREGLSAEVAAQLQETVKEAEIRVDEPTAEEAAALAAAAAAAAEASTAEAESQRKKLPYIVVIIDELADLMMVASKEVETSVARLAQMARAAGIHLMVATQRPSTDVVTGVIKANFPTRITFMLRSKPDSMTVLGTVGAEALLGMGDMLILPPTSAHLQRVHGCYVSEAEIKRAVDHLKAQGKPVYDESILKAREEEGATDGGEEDELSDELYDEAVAIVSEMRQVSISMLQRKMRIGYNRAARMIERMERDGMVGAADGAKPRDVLIRAVGEMPGAGAM
jgi:S-DNA-T family DNA segregation ATPase FtsK/SpoIIIE